MKKIRLVLYFFILLFICVVNVHAEETVKVLKFYFRIPEDEPVTFTYSSGSDLCRHSFPTNVFHVEKCYSIGFSSPKLESNYNWVMNYYIGMEEADIVSMEKQTDKECIFDLAVPTDTNDPEYNNHSTSFLVPSDFYSYSIYEEGNINIPSIVNYIILKEEFKKSDRYTLSWNCGSKSLLCYHRFNSFTFNNSKAFIKANTITADEQNKTFSLNSGSVSLYNEQTLLKKFNSPNPINYSILVYSLEENGKKSDNSITFEVDDKYVIIYSDDYKGVSLNSKDNLEYYPANLSKELDKKDIVELSKSTKNSPIEYNASIMQKTIKLKGLELNDFSIKNVEVLDISNGGVEVTKVDNEYRIIFNSNYYTDVMVKITDTSDKSYYINVKRTALKAEIKTISNKDCIYIPEFYYPKTNSYSDYIVKATIKYNNKETKVVTLDNAKLINDGLNEISNELEEDLESPSISTWVKGKGLKISSFKYELSKDELKSINKIYLNVENKGTNKDYYSGAYVANGNGILLKINS